MIVRREPFVLPLDRRLVAKPLGIHFPRRHHQMRVKIPAVSVCSEEPCGAWMAKSTAVPCLSAKPCANSRVSSNRCSAFNSCGSAISNSRATRASFRFSRCLGGIPQSRTIQSPFGSSPLRNDDLAMLDAMPPGEIMREPVALIRQAFRRRDRRRMPRRYAPTRG